MDTFKMIVMRCPKLVLAYNAPVPKTLDAHFLPELANNDRDNQQYENCDDGNCYNPIRSHPVQLISVSFFVISREQVR
jgi:hypothetical protein